MTLPTKSKKNDSMYGVTCRCGYDFDSDDLNGLITYWGEDPAQEMECPSCERVLTVKEVVTRVFEVRL